MSSGWWAGKWEHKNWKGSLEKLGIVVHQGPLAVFMNKKTLLVGNCSSTKGKPGTCREYYLGKGPQQLMDFAELWKYPYGILSDLHGLCYQDEIIEPYDVAPDQVANPEGVGNLIARKARERKVTRVVYYCTSPLRARPYLRFLYHSGLKVVYTTKLVVAEPAKGLGLS